MTFDPEKQLTRGDIFIAGWPVVIDTKRSKTLIFAKCQAICPIFWLRCMLTYWLAFINFYFDNWRLFRTQNDNLWSEDINFTPMHSTWDQRSICTVTPSVRRISDGRIICTLSFCQYCILPLSVIYQTFN